MSGLVDRWFLCAALYLLVAILFATACWSGMERPRGRLHALCVAFIAMLWLPYLVTYYLSLLVSKDSRRRRAARYQELLKERKK